MGWDGVDANRKRMGTDVGGSAGTDGRTHPVSSAYPPSAQDERTPLHVPIAIGSAVWYTWVT